MTTRFLKTRVGLVGASALVALIAVSGTSAFAGPAPAGRVATVSQPAAAEPTSNTDGDNVQAGDQTTPDTAAETAAEASGTADPAGDPNAAGPDPAGAEIENAADDTQSGAPASGASGTFGSAHIGVATSVSTKASVAHASSKKVAVGAAPAPTADPTADPAGGTDPAAESATETAGETSNEAANDGPGGHADPAGQDVNHYFQGEE